MTAYFHGNPTEIPPGSDGGLQTLVLMNPTTYLQYSDHHHHNNNNNNNHPQPNNNLVFLNSQHHHPPPPPAAPTTTTQHFVGIPLSAATENNNSNNNNNNISALHGFLPPRVHYNLYNHVDPTTACDTPRASQQGLSLTLSSQQQHHMNSFGSGHEDIRVSNGSASTGSAVTNGVSGLLSSKYLKAAQELLDEVVNVNNNNNNNNNHIDNRSAVLKKGSGSNNKVARESSATGGVERSAGGEAGGKRAAELTTAERQEIQMKKAKLISMLDEVEQRYRQYHHQMQIVISSFEQAAGIGSARTYTYLALKTISKQFRCLKDAIMGQIKAANKSLGEEDSSSGGKIEGSRLKFVDNHLRQQRALQQLGMIQHQNAWRPQRGLPERAVSVLRAWLFEHFLHPYPKDSDKHMLAKQTGLTRSQVSNWFINARVRLWKPMVEEMYLEEMKEQEKNGSVDKTEQNNNEDSASKSTSNQEKSPVTESHQTSNFMPKQDSSMHSNQNTPSISMSTAASMSHIRGGNVRNQSGFTLIGSSELEGITQGSPKRVRSNELMQSPTTVQPINMDVNFNEANNEKLNMKILDERQSRDGYSFIGNHNNFMGNFGQYPIGEMARFDAEQFTPRFSGNNGVSLTLGLPHCENLSVSGPHQSFLPNQNIQLGRRVEMGEANEFGAINTSSTPHSSSSAYDSISIQNQKRFAAQLLPDFVA